MLHDSETNDVIVINSDYLVYACVNEYSITTLMMSALFNDNNEEEISVYVKESIAKIYNMIDDKFICLHNSDDNTLAIFNIDKIIYSYYDNDAKHGNVVMDIEYRLSEFEVNETPHKILKKINEKNNIDKKEEK